MSPLYPINTWCDVNIYFNVGKAMFNGRTLYAEAFDHKGPIIFFIYGLGYLISNTSFFGMFIIQLIAWFIMVSAIYFSSKLFINKQLSLIAAFIFPLFLFKYTDHGGSAEEFVLVMEAFSLYFFLKYFKDANNNYANPKYMLVHGLTSSIAFFIKLNLIMFWLFPLLGTFICILKNRKWANLIQNLSYYILGFAIITVPICIYFYLNDALSEAYNVYFLTNSKYASVPQSASEIISLILSRIYLFCRGDLLGAFVILNGIFYFPYKYIQNKVGKASFVLCGISVFLIVSVTRSFFGYYNLPFYIFTALGWISILGYIQKYISFDVSRKATTFLCIIFILLSATQKNFFKVGGEAFFSKKGSGLVFEFAPEISKVKDAQLLNLGFGEANAIFTYCDIKPKITFFMTPNMPHELYPKLRDEQTRYIQQKEVDFVILTNATMNYDYFRELPSLNQNYELIDTYVDTDAYLKKINQFYTYYLYKKID